MIWLIAMGVTGALAGLVVDRFAVRLASGGTETNNPPRHIVHSLIRAAHAELGALTLRDQIVAGHLRRAIVVAVGAGTFAIAAARYDDPGHVAIVGAYMTALLVCACTDVLAYRVPNAVTYPAIGGALIIGLVMPGADVRAVLAAGAIAGGLLLVPSLVTGGIGMGMGDVKLAAFAGIAVGMHHIAPVLLLMALAGGAVAGILLITGTRRPGDGIAYAPFISGATIVVLLSHGTGFTSLAPPFA